MFITNEKMSFLEIVDTFVDETRHVYFVQSTPNLSKRLRLRRDYPRMMLRHLLYSVNDYSIIQNKEHSPNSIYNFVSKNFTPGTWSS